MQQLDKEPGLKELLKGTPEGLSRLRHETFQRRFKRGDYFGNKGSDSAGTGLIALDEILDAPAPRPGS